jgi:hypothetical protein
MKRNNLTPLALLAAACFALLSVPAQAQVKGKLAGQELEAPVPGAVTVSDYELNTFVFSAAIKRVYFPAGSPVLGSPIYLSENTQVMLQFSKGHTEPVQMVAELEDGQVVQLRVAPRAVAGVVHSVNGARVRARSASSGALAMNGAPVNAAPRGEDIEMLKHLVTTKEAPSGFEPVNLPGVTAFDKFSVVPLAAWSNGLKRLMIFSLVSAPGQTAVVANPQFYRPGITAVLLSGDVVDAQNSPQLLIVEELNDE